MTTLTVKRHPATNKPVVTSEATQAEADAFLRELLGYGPDDADGISDFGADD